MEQTVTTLSHDSNPLAYSLIKPLAITDTTLLAPGIWTGGDGKPTRYAAEEIQKGFANTRWDNMNLFLDHKDSKGSAVAYWIGFVKNVKIIGEELHGDLEIWHPLIALFIQKAKARFGVSATMNGFEQLNSGGGVINYEIHSFRSMSLVDEPGCEISWLPKMLSNSGKGDKTVFAGMISKDKIKELNKEDQDLYNQKEVKKMTEKNQSEEKAEEQNTATEEEKKEEASTESEKKTESSEEAKELSAKVDSLASSVSKIAENVKSLASLVQKSLSAGEESKEESEEKPEEKSEEKPEEKSEEEAKSEPEAEKELSTVKKELEETKKELSAAKAELNAPDKKTLATGNVAREGVTKDANAGMIDFLRKNANLE